MLGVDDPGPWRSLVSVPLHHVTGCNSQLLPACEFGGTTLIIPSFDALEFLRAIHEERITRAHVGAVGLSDGAREQRAEPDQHHRRALWFAPAQALGGNFTTTWTDVATALHVSTYSLQALSAATLPFFDGKGGSVWAWT